MYLGKAMLTHQDKNALMVPSTLPDHYILFLVYPWDHLVVVLDPAHYAEKTFTEFLVLLNLQVLAHKYYKDQSGRVKDASKSKLLVKTRWPNFQHSVASNHQALTYVDTTCARCFKLMGDICRYIRHDVCNHLGEFYDPESDLAKNDAFKRLREWEKEFT
uniref:Ubiquitin-like protease family profile domain-containing protein n=1 Tax=Oryza nivara TaxID=4536 RepID=A0A0E0GY41_ORYNI